MPTLEELVNTGLVNSETTITVMHMGWATTGNWFNDNILNWMQWPMKGLFYDGQKNHIDAMMEDSNEKESD